MVYIFVGDIVIYLIGVKLIVLDFVKNDEVWIKIVYSDDNIYGYFWFFFMGVLIILWILKNKWGFLYFIFMVYCVWIVLI